MKLTLPTDSTERKSYPMARGPLAYFPAALAGVAAVCEAGNRKHNPGEPLHHARGKSSDHADCIVRHLMDLQDITAAADREGLAFDVHTNPEHRAMIAAILGEASALAWRALALSQELHETYADAPLAPGARLPEAPPVPAGTADDVPVLFDYSHEIPPAPFGGVPYAELPPGTVVCGPAGADWRERGIARDEHGGTAAC